MKRFVSILLTLSFVIMLGQSVFAQVESLCPLVDPGYEWRYNVVEYNAHHVALEDSWINLQPMNLRVIGNETIEGKDYSYMQLLLNQTGTPTSLSYFYLREEDGAWYTYIDPDKYSHPEMMPLEKGEYLLYDFNLEAGDTFDAPAFDFDFFKANGYEDIDPDFSYPGVGMCHFKVKSKTVDKSGRRVLTLSGERIDYTFVGFIPEEIKVVEGVGPLSDGTLAMYCFMLAPISGYSANIDFLEIQDDKSGIVYLNPDQRNAGFLDSRDYTWIYGVFDSEGGVSYRKMQFNYYWTREYYQSEEYTSFRRFGTVGVSDSADGPWERTPFIDYSYVREENGKVWNSANDLLYDFNVTDCSTLTIYTTGGYVTAGITKGLTEVGGEEKLSYTFEGSDGVTCVEGIGITKGGILPAVNTEFDREAYGSFSNAVLVAVYDGDGNLIFRQDLPSEIKAIDSDNGFIAPAERIYDLQGRELREPVPDQPYIKGGKIFVETK